MATKQIELPEIGTVKLYKRKGARSIRLSVSSTGEVRVTLPYWLPFDAGVSFARSKQGWILSQTLAQDTAPITHGQAVGKSHHIYFRTITNPRISTRVNGTDIYIMHPAQVTSTDRRVQAAAEAASIRALRDQAEQLLPQRLKTLSETHRLPYRSVNVKRLKGRWGSCDADKNIVLNLFLMQLPWHLIDYVLLHELTHTKVLHHGADFWTEFDRHLPGAKKLRREIRAYRPAIEGNDAQTVSAMS